MPNTNMFNQQFFWWWNPPQNILQDDFIFDWYSLHNFAKWIRIRNVNYDDLWTIDLETFNNPQVDWGWVLSHLYHKKTITFNLSLQRSTYSALNNLIDEVKLETAKTEWLLEIRVNWEVRTCKASRSVVDFNRKYHQITFLSDVQLSFVTLDPHWSAKVADSTTYPMTWDLHEDISYLWTAPTFPVYYMVFWASGNAWITQLDITLWWKVLSIIQSITNNDILVIDSLNKTVKLNGTDLDYLGIFEEIVNGSNLIDFVFNVWATVNCTMNIIYNKRFY